MDITIMEELAMKIEGIAGSFRLMSGSDYIEDYERKMFHYFCQELFDIASQMVDTCYPKKEE